MRILLMDNEELYLRGIESALSPNPDLSLESILVDADRSPEEPPGEFDLLIAGITRRGWRQIQCVLLSMRGRYDRAIALVSDCSRIHIKEILASDFDSLAHRSMSVSTLDRAILHTLQACRYVDEPIGAWLLSDVASRWFAFNLTSREREIADLLMTDFTLADIGAHLRITHNTVKYHVTNVYRKVGVPGRRELRDVGGVPD